MAASGSSVQSFSLSLSTQVFQGGGQTVVTVTLPASSTSQSSTTSPVAASSTALSSTPSSSSVSSGSIAAVTTSATSIIIPADNSTTVVGEQSFTVNSAVSGKKYNAATAHVTANATSIGPLPVAFVTYTEQQSSGQTGVSSGATAGIAIATLLIGALIAAAAMLVVQRRKKRKSKPARPSAYAASNGEHGPVQPLAASTTEKSVAAKNTTDPDFLLPQPKDDQSMATAAKQLFVNIGDHVENFYHGSALHETITPQTEEDEFLINPRTRHAAIKRHICRSMLSAVAWNCSPAHSLLSAQAVAMAQQMAKGNLNENTYEVAWSRWRVSVGLLLKNRDHDQRRQAREYWVGQLQTKLRPFRIDSPGTKGELQRDLQAICDLAENLAILICSQPARWEFDWPRSEGRKDFVIFPEFGRSTDNKARRLDRTSRVLDAQRMQ